MYIYFVPKYLNCVLINRRLSMILVNNLHANAFPFNKVIDILNNSKHKQSNILACWGYILYFYIYMLTQALD